MPGGSLISWDGSSPSFWWGQLFPPLSSLLLPPPFLTCPSPFSPGRKTMVYFESKNMFAGNNHFGSFSGNQNIHLNQNARHFRLHYVSHLLIQWGLASHIRMAKAWGKTSLWRQLPPYNYGSEAKSSPTVRTSRWRQSIDVRFVCLLIQLTAHATATVQKWTVVNWSEYEKARR